MLVLLVAGSRGSGAEQGTEFFETRIRPVLAEQCYECHGAKKQKGGLRLDSSAAIVKGGESGAAFVAGDPEASLMVKAVRYLDEDLRMPPSKDGSKKLALAVIADFEAWVRTGAAMPLDGNGDGRVTNTEAREIDFVAERRKWAFHKPDAPVVPAIQHSPTAHNPIDAFILAKLEVRGLRPAPPADPRTLIRRMTFDLTGLPPTPEEVDAFVADSNRDPQSAIRDHADRLLASPAYGERWARHWLDVVRYADSLDSRILGKDGDILDAWRYRDWVVTALNRDLPYDEFVKQQVAGDILAARTWDREKVVATGMYAIGNWGNGDADKEKIYTDIVDDQIDVTGRAFLGLTLGCARCHDHKFDPITSADYYSLAGFFFSSHILSKFQSKGEGEKVMRIPLLTPAEMSQRATGQKRLLEIEAQLAGGLQPLDEFRKDINGVTGLNSWHGKSADTPSLTINTTNAEVKFATITLAARAISLHPGPKSAITAAWRSPVAGRVRVSAQLRDADGNCGDGIAWEVRHGAQAIGGGTFDNGGSAEFPEKEVVVEKGELVQLVIRPRAEYTCDSTQTEFLMRGEDGTVWDLRDTLASGAQQGHDSIWWICGGEGAQLGNDEPGRATLEKERDELAAQVGRVDYAHGFQDGGIAATPYEGFHDARIHVRGRYDRLGAPRPRAFPALLADDAHPRIEGSGRLALAEWLASAENPLTARVMVNRIWQHHFGEGIVRTPNNFGKLGTPPTHPELLDWLAAEFVKSGWSIKATHRAIMLSATYQQSCIPQPEALRDDSGNLLFSRMNRRRLDSEEIRDSLLAVAGKLDCTLGGPPLRDLPSNRRTLYVTTIRSDRATYQSLFDAADSTAIVEQRNSSTVAPQALFLLNHPFALAQSEAIARRFPNTADIDWLYRLLFARSATDEEKRVGTAAIAKLGLAQYCHALVCANEFVYVD